VVSFQERPGDSFDAVREPHPAGERADPLRGADFLLYSLCDAVLDAFFPTLEKLGDEVEDMEEKVLVSPVPETFLAIRRLKRELLAVRHAVWPRPRRAEPAADRGACADPAGDQGISADCYDHQIQLMDMVETFREWRSGWWTSTCPRSPTGMNEVMKVLTVVATIFIPSRFSSACTG